MLSKVVGNHFGVAKDVTAIMARVTYPYSARSYANAIDTALQDFRNRKANGGPSHAVVSMSEYWPNINTLKNVDGGPTSLGYPMAWINYIGTLLKNMVAEGMLVVVAAGNEGEVSQILEPLAASRSIEQVPFILFTLTFGPL
jgi:hypothetical protein